MADVPSPEIRIGDTERETAMTALGEHMSAGRLDIDEYGDRTAKVTAARTRGELSALFSDLPAPHPVFGQVRRPNVAPVAPPPAAPAPVVHSQPLAQRLVGAMVPLTGIIAVLLFFSFGHHWQVFLIPAAVAVLGGALVGDSRRTRRRDRW